MLLKMKVDAFGDGTDAFGTELMLFGTEQKASAPSQKASVPSQIHQHAKRKNPFRNDSDFFLVLFLILFS